MALSTITLDGNPVTLVDLPSSPGFRTVEWSFDDPAASVPASFSGKEQIQRWSGAEMLSGTMSLPPLTQTQADQWISFLLALRGRAYGFKLSDPLKRMPRGNLQRSVPQVDGSSDAFNVPGSDVLYTKGWSGAGRVFEAGDWLQIGYRLYRNLFPVIADGAGKAQLSVWPSLREQPEDNAAIVVRAAAGIFRLPATKRAASVDFTRLTAISLPFMEYRGSTYGS